MESWYFRADSGWETWDRDVQFKTLLDLDGIKDENMLGQLYSTLKLLQGQQFDIKRAYAVHNPRLKALCIDLMSSKT